MSTTVVQFSSDEITVRYREPYLTKGLNAKANAVQAPGIYRGFRLTTSSANDSVTIQADPSTLDHVAVFETGTGYSLTIRKTGGSITLDLTPAYGVDDVIIFGIFADYTLGSDTTAEIRAYTRAEYEALSTSERGRIIVLGTVTLSSIGMEIPPGNITHKRRDDAWARVARGRTPWSPLLRNGGFESARLTSPTSAVANKYDADYWELDSASATDGWFITNTDKYSGTNSLEFAVTAATLPATVSEAYQRVNVSVTVGQLIRITAKVQQLLIQSDVGTDGYPYMFFEWSDSTGAVGTKTTVDLPMDKSPAPLTFLDLSEIEANSTAAPFDNPADMIEVPTGAAFLRRFGFAVPASADFNWSSGVTPVFRIDDVQIWLEAESATDRSQYEERRGAPTITAPLILEDPATDFTSTARGLAVTYDSTADKLSFVKRGTSTASFLHICAATPSTGNDSNCTSSLVSGTVSRGHLSTGVMGAASCSFDLTFSDLGTGVLPYPVTQLIGTTPAGAKVFISSVSQSLGTTTVSFTCTADAGGGTIQFYYQLLF